MILFRCCCNWSYVVGKKQVYGPIWPMGIGTYPDALSPSQHMMTRAQWQDNYSDCVACYEGRHLHQEAKEGL